MTRARPLLALLEDLRVDASERSAFSNDPDGYLAAHGWADLDAADLRDAVGFVRESAPLDVAVTMPDLAVDASVPDLLGQYVAAVAVDDLEAFGSDAAPFQLDDAPAFSEPEIDLDAGLSDLDDLPVAHTAAIEHDDLDDDDDDDFEDDDFDL